MKPLFTDRIDAGRRLTTELKAYNHQPSTLVLGIPRGGVVVASEIAQALSLPLDFVVVRKLGVPGQEEFAMGAIARDDFSLLNPEIVDSLQITEADIQRVLRREKTELERREQVYRMGLRPLPLTGRTIILTDDGVATGSTVLAAVRMLRREHPARIVIAVPVAPPDAWVTLKAEVDEIICLKTPEPFHAIGSWYRDFPSTSDKEVCTLLRRAHERNLPDTH